MPTTDISLAQHLEQTLESPARAPCVLALATAAGQVATLLSRGKRAVLTGTHNTHGESVRDVDLAANQLFVDALAQSRTCQAVVSEELAEPLRIPGADAGSLLFLDPLDGSANLDAHGLAGTVFGIAPVTGELAEAALTRGRDFELAGYFLYSSATILVLASTRRVDLLVWDATLGSFVLEREQLRCPERGSIYSVNEARVSEWAPQAQSWLAELKAERKPSGTARYSQRYVGCLVADAHRLLLQGGVFAYPEDAQNARGKLRLQYEVNPMALIFEAAGGAATVGRSSPLDQSPGDCHERSPLVLGSREEVRAYERHAAQRRPSFAPAA